MIESLKKKNSHILPSLYKILVLIIEQMCQVTWKCN